MIADNHATIRANLMIGVDSLQTFAQTYDGYVENGKFYPRQSLASSANRFLAVLTVIEVPVAESIPENDRRTHLNDLMRSIRKDTTPKLRMEDFPRFDLERNPVVFTNNEEKL
jgi:hypothetical protein